MVSKDNIRCLMLGDVFPDLKGNTSDGEISLYDYMGDGWLLFFSHPRDFTPVCTTELGRVAKLKDEFAKRNTKVIALSCDKVDSHKEWIKDIDRTQSCVVNFPIIADEDFKLARQCGMYHPEIDPKATVRSCFIISPNKKVRLIIQYPPSTGRNFDEVLRCLDSLQLTDKYSVATPENWKEGDKVVIIPSIKNEQAKEKFPQGWEEVTPYLRMVQLEKK